MKYRFFTAVFIEADNAEEAAAKFESQSTYDWQMERVGNDGKCSICGDPIYGLVQIHHHNEPCEKCGDEIIATQPHACKPKGGGGYGNPSL